MTLRVEVVVPDGRIWSGNARMVIAKTLDGDLGVLTGHPPVLGILAEGGVIRVMDPHDEGAAGAGDGGPSQELRVAVSSGFLAVAGNRVSVLARQAELGSRVDQAAVQAELDAALAEPGSGAEDEAAEVKYSRALLRAADDRS